MLSHDATEDGGSAASPRRLRIAFVVHDYHRHGGQSRYVAELAGRFKREHEVHVFANRFEEADPAGLTYHHVPAWRRNALATVVSFVLPATLMVSRRFDVIHAQGLCGLRHNVVTAHICQGAWYEAMVKNAGRPGWRKRLFHGVVSRLERLAFRPGAGRRVIAVSQRVQDDLAAHYGCRDRVTVIPHGVDTETFHPRNRARWRQEVRREAGVPEDACVALYVGDLQKAMPAAIRAVARVPSVRLVAVSRSPADPYRELAREAGVADRAHFLPPTDQVERCYAAADLYLFPTYYDAFGLVVTEAMASGLPVVASRAAGAAELIDHGADGLLVDDPWDAGALAEAVGRLAASPDLRDRLGEAARRKVEGCTWDEVARRTMAVYQELAASGRG
jgi:UDP-glucose:(heptosyl)LPS alpha-1,3-glucosyltransferase